MSAENTVNDLLSTLEVQNVVASTGVGQELDLKSLDMDLRGSDFDPEQFPGLIYRPDETEATCLVFRSGNITCTGGGSVAGVHETINTTVDRLRELGIQAETHTVTVENIVSGADLGETLNLNAVAIGLGLETVEYEPEQFPGLVHRIDEPEVVALLFGSGKIVITGAKTRDEPEAAPEGVIRRLNDLSLLH